MEPLDSPVKLHYKNGNNFPKNFVLIAYVTLAVSVALAVTGSYVTGAVLFVLTTLPLSNRHHVVIDTDKGIVHDYTAMLGFIKIGKKYPLNKFRYVTSMPLIQSHNVQNNLVQQYAVTERSVTVTFFGERLRGKCIITKFDSKNEAEEIAQKLGDRLDLRYFEYDPQLARKILLGEITL